MRIDTDSTLEEVVEMQLWVVERSRLLATARWKATVVSSLIAGGALTLFVSEPWPINLAFGALGAAFAGAATFATYRWDFRRRLRKLCRKQRGNDPIPISLELDAEGIHCRSHDARFSSAWSNVKSIEDRDGTVIFWMRDMGITVARKRAFSSPDEQREFLTLAQKYHRDTQTPAS